MREVVKHAKTTILCFVTTWGQFSQSLARHEVNRNLGKFRLKKQHAQLPSLKQYCINSTIRTASRSCSQRDLRQVTIRLVRPILTRMDTDGHPEVDTEGQLWTQIDLNAHTPHAILSSALLTAR